MLIFKAKHCASKKCVRANTHRHTHTHTRSSTQHVQVGAWIVDPKGGLMCAAADIDVQQQQLQQHGDAIIWMESRDTMASRAALTAEMQANPTHKHQPVIPFLLTSNTAHLITRLCLWQSPQPDGMGACHVHNRIISRQIWSHYVRAVPFR